MTSSYHIDILSPRMLDEITGEIRRLTREERELYRKATLRRSQVSDETKPEVNGELAKGAPPPK